MAYLNDEQIADLKKDLNARVVNVSFKKVTDGSTRKMRCTRKLALIPEQFHPKMKTRAKPDVAVVFDLDANDWRSFHYNSVRSAKVAAEPVAARKA
jgi:hypothetical protein